MGQCSTLPAEARAATSSVASRHDASGFHNGVDPMQESKHRLKDDGRKESLDFNKLVETPEGPPTPETPSQKGVKRSNFDRGESVHSQNRDDGGKAAPTVEAEQMDVDSREDVPPTPIPPPPEGAVRTRCYKLNLDSEFVGLTASQNKQVCLGPFTEPPPYLTYSSSSDSSSGPNATTVAIQTAQIFRGITVGRDGTILSQNARATRSNRGNKTKRGEKSRQAAKIDKANDLVEESIAKSAASDADEPNNMVSLVIVGEYDDMKQLVRDGAKKLREANGLPDEALLAVNRPRRNQQKTAKPVSTSTNSVNSSLLSPPRMRVSPNFVNSQRTAAMQPPEKELSPTTVSPTAPPKLKSHPRDNRSNRREERTGPRMRLESCHEFMDPRRAGVAGDGDWSHAWNIWNCGAGTVSPLQPSSPNEGTSKPVFEGRDAGFTNTRDAGITTRAN